MEKYRYVYGYCGRKGKGYTAVPDGFETTGRVIMNFETARQMVRRSEGDGHKVLRDVRQYK
ncbi:hypothetical protein VQ056_00640 [Paenibacillus sp. JTLBN-2024]